MVPRGHLAETEISTYKTDVPLSGLFIWNVDNSTVIDLVKKKLKKFK